MIDLHAGGLRYQKDTRRQIQDAKCHSLPTVHAPFGLMTFNTALKPSSTQTYLDCPKVTWQQQDNCHHTGNKAAAEQFTEQIDHDGADSKEQMKKWRHWVSGNQNRSKERPSHFSTGAAEAEERCSGHSTTRQGLGRTKEMTWGGSKSPPLLLR